MCPPATGVRSHYGERQGSDIEPAAGTDAPHYNGSFGSWRRTEVPTPSRFRPTWLATSPARLGGSFCIKTGIALQRPWSNRTTHGTAGMPVSHHFGRVGFERSRKQSFPLVPIAGFTPARFPRDGKQRICPPCLYFHHIDMDAGLFPAVSFRAAERTGAADAIAAGVRGETRTRVRQLMRLDWDHLQLPRHLYAQPELHWGRHGHRSCFYGPQLTEVSMRHYPSHHMERDTGFEPAQPAWKAGVLPITPISHLSGSGDLHPSTRRLLHQPCSRRDPYRFVILYIPTKGGVLL